VQGVVIPDDAELEPAGGGSKKTVLWISLAAVAAALVVGGIVFVVINKGDKTSESAKAETGDGESSSGQASGGSAPGASGGGMDNGMGMGMDGGMAMDGDMAMGMAMDGASGADSGKVMALLQKKCFNCHGNGKKKGGYSLDSRDAALDAIKPGNPDGSLLIELVRRDDPDSAMPPKQADALTKDEVAMVAAWIKAGAKF